jgi:lysophospholipase L1-like esterase
MKTILIFGASSVHGVGGERGGWADKLKANLHAEMYASGASEASGENITVYELGVPGNTLPEVESRFIAEVEARTAHSKPEDVIIVFSAGTNDSRAIDAIDNHLSSPDDFAAVAHSFVHLAKDYAAYILGVGVCPVDESKTSPIQGDGSYFSNERIKSFEEALRRTCDEEGVPFVPLFDQAPADWAQSYVFADGLHPNDRGHEWIRSQVEPELRKILGSPA